MLYFTADFYVMSTDFHVISPHQSVSFQLDLTLFQFCCVSVKSYFASVMSGCSVLFCVSFNLGLSAKYCGLSAK